MPPAGPNPDRLMLRLLLLEDNPDDAELVNLALEDHELLSATLTVAATLSQAQAELAAGSFDAVLTEMNLPDSVGMDTVDAMVAACAATPLVVLTGTSDARVGVRAVHRGAQDYLPKSELAGPSLGRAIRHSLERAHIQRQLREAHQRFRSAFDDSPLGGMVISLERSDLGRFLQVNDAFTRLVGVPRSELANWTLTELAPAEDRDVLLAALADLAGGGERTTDCEQRLNRPGGPAIWAQLHFSAVTGSDGNLYAICTADDITVQRRNRDALQQRASHDPLTGLANRELLLQRLATALAQQPDTRLPLAVFFIDLDGFKALNDTRGRAAGDDLLVECAHGLRGAVRPADTVARVGGDEFVVLCPEIAAGDAADALADRLVATVATAAGAGQTGVSASIGLVVLATPAPAISPEALLSAADAAMYQAKRAGGRCWHRARGPAHGSGATGSVEMSTGGEKRSDHDNIR